MSNVNLDRATAIETWITGYLHLRAPIDGATRDVTDGLTFARYPRPVRPLNAEFFVQEPAPAYDAARALASSVGTHCLTVFEQSGQRADYSAFGYSLRVEESLMACPITDGHRLLGQVERITVPGVAARINAALGTITFVAEHIADPAISVFGCTEDGELVAWGANIWATPDLPYVSRIYTWPAYRRRGLATQVMRALLHEAAERGARFSVLSASEMARALYMRLGYREIAPMRIWYSRERTSRE